MKPSLHRAVNVRQGTTLIEFSIASSILALVVLATMQLVQRDADISQATLGIALAERQAQEMLRELESELAFARGELPRTTLSEMLSPSNSLNVRVNSTEGFPSQGVLIVDRGTASEERISYQRFGAGVPEFRFLDRGEQCTSAFTHAKDAGVMWAGLAQVLAPGVEGFDGVALEPGGPAFFQGDGIGFSYRLPIAVQAPGDTPNYLNPTGQVVWGAELDGAAIPEGRIAIYFRPSLVVVEAELRQDLNRDGDLEDAYDVGQLRKRIWNAVDANQPARDIGIGPRTVLQERCDWGGDLDADGFDDPLFLWDANSKRLHVRLFLVGQSLEDSPVVRRVESLIFLRNDPQG